MLGRLESAVSQIKQFTADASHELRGPLSFTRTVAEVALRNPHADQESRRAFQDIVDESAKATELLEGMLTLARADAKSFDAPLEQLNLAEVVHQVCEMARPLAAQHQIDLSVSIDPAASPIVLGDFTSLRRLAWILVDNALKYTPTRGRINVTLTEQAGTAVLSVSDTGIGIAAHDLPRIFDRFYRADPSRSQVEGSGLGLAIARWIAEMHQADLTVTSTEHRGTTFRITFPLCINLLPGPRENQPATDLLAKAV
jgi:signal transduction histidine kinase